MASTYTYSAFGKTLEGPRYALYTPSEIEAGKLFHNRFAVAFRNTFGVINWRYFETREAAEAHIIASANSPLCKIAGFEFDAADYQLVEAQG